MRSFEAHTWLSSTCGDRHWHYESSCRPRKNPPTSADILADGESKPFGSEAKWAKPDYFRSLRTLVLSIPVISATDVSATVVGAPADAANVDGTNVAGATVAWATVTCF